MLSVAYRCRWRDYSLPFRINRRSPLSEKKDPGVLPAAPRRLLSVVIPCHNHAEALAGNLPAILEQDFPADRYEVIVVDDDSTDDTLQVVRSLESRYPHLRHTFVPPTARFVVRRKLAITLGIRAARGPWVLITLPECRPLGREWLYAMARRFTDDADFVLGYATYINDGSRRVRRAIWENLQQQLIRYRSASDGRAIGGDLCNMGLRKSLFMEKRGFADSLALGFGEGDLLVDALAEKGRVLLELHPEAMVRRPLPEPKDLVKERIGRVHMMHHLSFRGRMCHMRNAAATWAMHLLALSVAFRAYMLTAKAVSGEGYAGQDLCYDLPLLLSACVAAALPAFMLRRSADSMGERRYGAFHPLYALLQPWRQAWYRLRAWRHRQDFFRKI